MRRQEPILLQVSLENGANQGFFSLSTYGPARLARYLVAFLGVVRAPEGLDPEQTYQVSCQHCSDEGSPQYPCQAHNCSNVKRPIVHLANLANLRHGDECNWTRTKCRRCLLGAVGRRVKYRL